MSGRCGPTCRLVGAYLGSGRRLAAGGDWWQVVPARPGVAGAGPSRHEDAGPRPRLPGRKFQSHPGVPPGRLIASASTSPTRRSRMVIFVWSELTPRSSWQTSSQRDFILPRGRPASRRSSMVAGDNHYRKGRRSSRGEFRRSGLSSRVTSALTRGDRTSPGSQGPS